MLAVGQKNLPELTNRLKLRPLFAKNLPMIFAQWKPLFSICYGILEQITPRKLPSPHTAAMLVSCVPKSDDTCHGVCRQRTPLGNLLKSLVKVEARGISSARRASAANPSHPADAVSHQPKAVATKTVHMRVHNRERSSGCKCSFDRVAALPQNFKTRLGCQSVWRRNHPIPRRRELLACHYRLLTRSCHHRISSDSLFLLSPAMHRVALPQLPAKTIIPDITHSKRRPTSRACSLNAESRRVLACPFSASNSSRVGYP